MFDAKWLPVTLVAWFTLTAVWLSEMPKVEAMPAVVGLSAALTVDCYLMSAVEETPIIRYFC